MVTANTAVVVSRAVQHHIWTAVYVIAAVSTLSTRIWTLESARFGLWQVLCPLSRKPIPEIVGIWE